MPGSPSRPGPASHPPGHCPHCWGACDGNCRIPGLGGCIHRGPKLPWRVRLRLMGTGRFWRRVLFGVH